jgi:trk system potassium uptake protein TrkA
MARKNPKPEFAVIGLGRFGSSLALALAEHGYDVLGIDQNRDIVQAMADEIAQAVALDSTDEDALMAVDIRSFDTVIVAIGTDFEANLLTTLALKSVGVRHVICKALSQRHRTALLAVGADQVILPEHDSARRLAATIKMPRLFDQLALSSEYSISEVWLPASLGGQTLRAADLRTRLGVTIIAVKRGDGLVVSPSADFVLAQGDLLAVIGRNDAIARLSELA